MRVRIPLLAMKKYLRIISVVLICLVILFIGVFQKTKTLSIQSKEPVGYKTYNSIIKSAPDDLKELISLADPNNDRKLNMEINKGLQEELIKLSSKSLDVQNEIFSFLSPYLAKIKISDSKNELDYLNEFKSAVSPLKLVVLDFNNKNNLNDSGDVFLSILNNLSNIEVPKSLENIHKSEMVILGSMGYVIKRLAITTDSEEGVILIRLLEDLSNMQEELINKLTK